MPKLNIEIGCPPGNPRPFTLLMQLINILSNSQKEKIALWSKNYLQNPPDSSILFGDMECSLDIDEDIKEDVVVFFQTQLTSLYNSGVIRYASW